MVVSRDRSLLAGAVVFGACSLLLALSACAGGNAQETRPATHPGDTTPPPFDAETLELLARMDAITYNPGAAGAKKVFFKGAFSIERPDLATPVVGIFEYRWDGTAAKGELTFSDKTSEGVALRSGFSRELFDAQYRNETWRDKLEGATIRIEKTPEGIVIHADGGKRGIRRVKLAENCTPTEMVVVPPKSSEGTATIEYAKCGNRFAPSRVRMVVDVVGQGKMEGVIEMQYTRIGDFFVWSSYRTVQKRSDVVAYTMNITFSDYRFNDEVK